MGPHLNGRSAGSGLLNKWRQVVGPRGEGSLAFGGHLPGLMLLVARSAPSR